MSSYAKILLGFAVAAPVAVVLQQVLYRSDWNAACPNLPEISDKESLKHFSPEMFEGTWYRVARSEPITPSFCECDEMTWKLEENKEAFRSNLLLRCPFEINIPAEGALLDSGEQQRDPSQWKVGIKAGEYLTKLVDQKVIYVERDIGTGVMSSLRSQYDSAIVVSCSPNYYWGPFLSLEILARKPLLIDDVELLVEKARHLGVPTSLTTSVHITNFENCPGVEMPIPEILKGESDQRKKSSRGFHVGERIRSMWLNWGRKLEEHKENLWERASQAGDAARDKLESIREKGREAKDYVGDKISEGADVVREAPGKVKESVEQTGERAYEKLAEGGERAKEYVQEKAEDVREAAAKGRDYLKDTGESAYDKAAQRAEEAKDFVRDQGGKAAEGAEAAKEYLQDKAGDAYAGMAEGTDKVKGYVQEKASSAAEKAKDYLRNAEEYVTGKAAQGAEKARDYLEEKHREVAEENQRQQRRQQ